VIVCLLGLTVLVTVPRPAVADEAQDAKQLVEKARLTFEAFVADKDLGPPLKSLFKRAKGVLIYPQVLRGAFIFGASGGSGTFLVHDAQAGAWGGRPSTPSGRQALACRSEGTPRRSSWSH
jgi:lipid-binding SYLF domain-containing protein